MKAMVINRIVALREDAAPLQLVELPVPEPAAGEVRIRVSACGVCHTELDEIEGRTAPSQLPVVPGHEAIGRVDSCGAGATRFVPGTRVGVGWIHHSSGRRGGEPEPGFVATGRDCNGGYAEYLDRAGGLRLPHTGRVFRCRGSTIAVCRAASAIAP